MVIFRVSHASRSDYFFYTDLFLAMQQTASTLWTAQANWTSPRHPINYDRHIDSPVELFRKTSHI